MSFQGIKSRPPGDAVGKYIDICAQILYVAPREKFFPPNPTLMNGNGYAKKNTVRQ